MDHFHNQVKCLYIIGKVKSSGLLIFLLGFLKYTDGEGAVEKGGPLVKRG